MLLTGVPVGVGSDKVVKIVEQSGADVVAFENCSEYKQTFTVAEDKDPMDALAVQKVFLAPPPPRGQTVITSSWDAWIVVRLLPDLDVGPRFSTATSSRSTGPRTATAAGTWERICGTDAEAGTTAGFDIVNGDTPALLQQILFDKKL